MEKIKVTASTKRTLLIIVASILVGAFLAKIAPLTEASSKEEASADAVVKKKEEQPKVQPKLDYMDQVNQEIKNGTFQGRLTIPLVIQTKAPWTDIAYGISEDEKNNTLGINGCAIVSLSMIATYLDQKEYSPQDVLDWSKNDYFVENQGTTWSIFSDFAMKKGYVFEDLVGDIDAVTRHLQAKHPVIISVKPGFFTETGHIMVLTGTLDGKFWLNDPNDTEEKNHSQTLFTADELLNEAMNFWAIYQ